jgi:phosphate transport system substrate-binding protein
MLSIGGEIRSIAVSRTAQLIIAGLILLVVACGYNVEGGAETIVIDGSSTVFPIVEAAAEEFGLLTGGSVRVAVGVSGTGGGFKKFCSGETAITSASRPIKAGEVDLCAEAGVDFIELPVAYDGVTVMVNPEAEFVQCMTIEELHTIWAPEAEGKVTHWNQVRPEWPDQRLQLYGPGVDSGTFDYFTETINGEAQASRGDFTASENDNVLVQGISGDKNSLGFFGYAYYYENAEKLKALAIDGGDGCVAPTGASINDGSYAPLSRPLFLYVTKSSAETPMIQEFIRYCFSPEGQELVSEVGYVPFQPNIYEMALDRFETTKTGTLFGGNNPRTGTVEEILSPVP